MEWSPIGSMYDICIPISSWFLWQISIYIDKFTSPMDSMGLLWLEFSKWLGYGLGNKFQTFFPHGHTFWSWMCDNRSLKQANSTIRKISIYNTASNIRADRTSEIGVSIDFAWKSGTTCGWIQHIYIYISSWWFQPIWKLLVKLDHFPN